MFSRTIGPPSLHMALSVLEYYQSNQMVQPEGNKKMMQPEHHILLWWVWERPGAASLKQTTASHSSPH